MVTLQILVLPFLVRVRVPQQQSAASLKFSLQRIFCVSEHKEVLFCTLCVSYCFVTFEVPLQHKRNEKLPFFRKNDTVFTFLLYLCIRE